MATDATVTVESSPTEVLKSLTPAQHKTWRETGNLPEPQKEEKKLEVKDSKTEAVSSPAAKEVPESAPAKAATEAPAESAPATPKPGSPAEARIKDLLAENKKLATELETLRKSPIAAPAKKDEAPAKPHRNDTEEKTGQPLYATDADFETAYEKWMTEKVSHDVRKQIAKESEMLRVAEQNKLIEKRLSNGVKIATEKHSDFLTVLKAETKDGKTVFGCEAVKFIKTNGILDAWLQDSEMGMEILYHLAKNPDEIERIQSLNAFSAARELTKLEDKLSVTTPTIPAKKEENTPAPKVSGAPAPAASVSGKATAPVDEEEAAVAAEDFRRFQKAANAEEFRKKKAS